MRSTIIIFITCLICSKNLLAQQSVPLKPRILISTDIGGTDPDDNQSIAHYLMYSDLFVTEGLISSPSYGNGNKSEILRMIDLYAKDLPKLAKHVKDLPSPEYLRSITKQGRKGVVPYCGYAMPTEGSDWIIECARRKSEAPLWILIWGGLDDVAQALHDAPDIQDKIRIYWIGGPNKKWSANSYVYIVENFPNLWFIENNASYRGFIGNKKVADVYNAGYYDTFIKNAGNLGADFIDYYGGLPKLGDTPSLLYMMDGDPNNPMKESWGGRFEKMSYSPQIIIDKPANAQDTVPVYSIIEFRMKGPLMNIPSDSICITLNIRNQNWGGYYLGNGIYAVRYSTYNLGVFRYTIVSDIPNFRKQEGTLTIDEAWPGRRHDTDWSLGDSWFTDMSNPALFEKHCQGSKTISRWRVDVMADWGKRWSWLKESN